MFLVLIIVLFASCASNNYNKQINPEDGQVSTEGIPISKENEYTGTDDEEGEKQMAKVDYMTKEEFIEFVSLRNLNVTVEDFSDIDLDDFIHEQFMTKGLFDVEDVEKFDFKDSLKWYKKKLEHKKLEPYMAKEIICVDSTDEEYGFFKEEYFRTIDSSYQVSLLHVDEYGLDNYSIFTGEKSHRIQIGQTQNLEKCYTTKNNAEFYCVTYIIDASGLQVSIPIIYNKNSKYFILANDSDEIEFELMRISCEMGM
jgi:hypothetical protein